MTRIKSLETPEKELDFILRYTQEKAAEEILREMG